MVVVVARSASAWLLLAVMVPWTGTEGVVSLPLVRSCGGDNATDEQEPGMEELCVEEPFYFW
jgi:hypothetical protein